MIQQTLLQSLASMAREEVADTARAANETATADTLFSDGDSEKDEGQKREVGGLAEASEEAVLGGNPTDAGYVSNSSDSTKAERKCLDCRISLEV